MSRFAALLLAGLLAAASARAAPIAATGGRFEADVSARQMSRISIQGERIVSIRKLDEPVGPQMLVEADEKSGDAFVAFDGDVAGRAFNAFLTTESGRVVQAILRPVGGDGQTILVRLESDPPSRPATPRPPGSAGVAAPSPYAEALVQFVRQMFNDQESESAVRHVATSPAMRAGPFSLREVTTWESASLQGHVLYITNLGKTEEPVRLEAFLVERIYAAAASHERLRPGEQGRVFIVEEAR